VSRATPRPNDANAPHCVNYSNFAPKSRAEGSGIMAPACWAPR